LKLRRKIEVIIIIIEEFKTKDTTNNIKYLCNNSNSDEDSFGTHSTSKKTFDELNNNVNSSNQSQCDFSNNKCVSNGSNSYCKKSKFKKRVKGEKKQKKFVNNNERSNTKHNYFIILVSPASKCAQKVFKWC